MSSEEFGINIEILKLNGLLISSVCLPREIIGNILSFLNWPDLLSCRLVCELWKRLIDNFVGLHKLKRDHKNILRTSFDQTVPTYFNHGNMPFFLCFAIAKHVFGKNHLKNPCGEDPSEYNYWTQLLSGGDGWSIENEPLGSSPVPQSVGSSSCFVTSYGRCYKEQLISLKECGLNNKIMDDIRPNIEVSDWYAKRFDCGIKYIIHVALLDSERKPLYNFTQNLAEREGFGEWHQVSHTFKDYTPGVRYVLFQHGGRDTQYWAGHYGSKMTGASVIARLTS